MKLSMMTFSMMTFSIMTLSVMTFSIITISITTLKIRKSALWQNNDMLIDVVLSIVTPLQPSITFKSKAEPPLVEQPSGSPLQDKLLALPGACTIQHYGFVIYGNWADFVVG
jgi:hypothetical protein